MTIVTSKRLIISAVFVILQLVTGSADPPKQPEASTNRPILPSIFGPDGRVTLEGERFTTPAYRREALRLVIQEANDVAKALQLREKLPITQGDLKEAFIVPYGMSHVLIKP